jgi:hypothetical protein
MPEKNPPEPPTPERTLEMRVADLEDKMSKIYITEEEWKAYQKVATLLGQCTSGAIVAPVGLLCAVYRVACGVYLRCVANPFFGEGGSAATGFGSLGS